MKLSRIVQKIFGINAPNTDMGVIGSLHEGNPTEATNVGDAQNLTAFENGLRSILIGENSPILEEDNALYRLITYQLKYLFQNGIPEWSATEEYFKGSVVNHDGVIYRSEIDSNTGSNPSQGIGWIREIKNKSNPFGASAMRNNTESTTIPDYQWSGLAYSEAMGVYLACSYKSPTNSFIYSTTGVNSSWIAKTNPDNTGDHLDIFWSKVFKKFFLFTKNSSDVIIVRSSENGVSWDIEYTVPLGNSSINSVCDGSDKLIFSVQGGYVYSYDGTTWLNISSYAPFSGTYTRIAYSPKMKIFGCISGEQGAFLYCDENDVTVWSDTPFPIGSGHNFYTPYIIWDNIQDVFVCTGRETVGSNAALFISKNGINWESISPKREDGTAMAENYTIYSCEDLGVYVTINLSSVYISTDLNVWTQVNYSSWPMHSNRQVPYCYSKRLGTLSIQPNNKKTFFSF